MLSMTFMLMDSIDDCNMRISCINFPLGFPFVNRITKATTTGAASRTPGTSTRGGLRV